MKLIHEKFIEFRDRREARMRKHMVLLFAVLMLAATIGGAMATDYCGNQSATTSVFVQYSNNSAAESATVTISLWNGTADTMINKGSGIYNYTFTTPAYIIGSSNTYYNYFDSVDPTASGAEDFYIQENCSIISTTVEVSSLFSAIILLPLVFGIILIAGAFMFGETHAVLKIFLFLFAYCMIFIGLWFASVTVVEYLGFPELINDFGTVTWIFGTILFVILAYFLIYTFIIATKQAAQDKQARLEY